MSTALVGLLAGRVEAQEMGVVFDLAAGPVPPPCPVGSVPIDG